MTRSLWTDSINFLDAVRACGASWAPAHAAAAEVSRRRAAEWRTRSAKHVVLRAWVFGHFGANVVIGPRSRRKSGSITVLKARWAHAAFVGVQKTLAFRDVVLEEETERRSSMTRSGRREKGAQSSAGFRVGELHASRLVTSGGCQSRDRDRVLAPAQAIGAARRRCANRHCTDRVFSGRAGARDVDDAQTQLARRPRTRCCRAVRGLTGGKRAAGVEIARGRFRAHHPVDHGGGANVG